MLPNPAPSALLAALSMNLGQKIDSSPRPFPGSRSRGRGKRVAVCRDSMSELPVWRILTVSFCLLAQSVRQPLLPRHAILSSIIAAILGLLISCLPAQAHIGSPNIFVDGKAGAYPVQVVIRPPPVVPGLAQISVRVPGQLVHRVTVLPVFWNAGRKGAPPPDTAKPVPGETNLFSAALWLMKPGAYSVEIMIEGARGPGTLVVPVNSMATNTRPMSRGYRLMLWSLGICLFLGGLKIAGLIFSESCLEPEARPTSKDRWRGRAAMVVAALVLSLLVFGGKKWWDFEDTDYRNNSLYAPLPVSAQVWTERDQHILRLTVKTSERRGQWTPLIPDHGKMMHLFLVRDSEPGAFAHLHPVPRKGAEFEVPLPPLPTGQYQLYADVTHENGFSETLTASVEVPPASVEMRRLWLGNSAEPICSLGIAQMLERNLYFPPDMDDSWQMNNAPIPSAKSSESRSLDGTTVVAEISGGYKMIWTNPGPLVENREAALRFNLMMPNNEPALIEPYMGMSGHAVVRRRDGAVFAHIHPLGTFSMAAQDFFMKGQLPKSRASNAPPDSVPGADQRPGTDLHRDHTNEIGVAEEISFPYAFPKSGPYRIWVQAKSQERILTGVFDATVGAAK